MDPTTTTRPLTGDPGDEVSDDVALRETPPTTEQVLALERAAMATLARRRAALSGAIKLYCQERDYIDSALSFYVGTLRTKNGEPVYSFREEDVLVKFYPGRRFIQKIGRSRFRIIKPRRISVKVVGFEDGDDE